MFSDNAFNCLGKQTLRLIRSLLLRVGKCRLGLGEYQRLSGFGITVAEFRRIGPILSRIDRITYPLIDALFSQI